jgi:hypothetical protein
LEQLEHLILHLSGEPRLVGADFRFLSRLRNLRSLEISSVDGVGDDIVRHLAPLSRLLSLSLTAELTDAGLAAMPRLPNLRLLR